MRSSAFLGLANLAANASNHRSILQENCLEFLIEGAAIAASEPTAPGAAAPERLLSVDEPAPSSGLTGPAVLAWCGSGRFSVGVTAVAGSVEEAEDEVRAVLAEQLDRLPPR